MLTKSLHLRQRRPSMLSHPKYRHKEEKRKLLKLSCRKLKKLSDPESVLCKAVLINNTLKYLQQNSANVSQPPPSPRLLADSQPETETDLDILNTEIQFPPPLTPLLSEENVSTENDFFNLCYHQLPQPDLHVLRAEMETQELYRDLRNRNDLRSDSDTAATSEEISYQDQSSQVYNISSYSSSSSNNKTNNSSNCSNSASSQSLLNLPLHPGLHTGLHRIVECKV